MSCLVIMNNAISDSTANRHKAAIVSVLNNKNAISTNTNNVFRDLSIVLLYRVLVLMYYKYSN